ncbi:hypothetical protein D9M73_196260 [compost metagenome]
MAMPAALPTDPLEPQIGGVVDGLVMVAGTQPVILNTLLATVMPAPAVMVSTLPSALKVMSALSGTGGCWAGSRGLRPSM